MKKPLFGASLMCMDLLHVKREVIDLNNGCDILHADVMDGHFASNLTLSPDFIKAVKSCATLPIDVHLMVNKPEAYIDTLLAIKVDYISVHLETISNDAFRILRKIKAGGAKFGLALNPATPLESASLLLSEVDLLTIMTVDVGFAGQAFIPQMLEKIKKAKELKEKQGHNYIIQIDGACGPKTYNDLWQAGAEAFVMGTSGLFGRADTLAQGCALMRQEFDTAIEGS